MPPKRTEFATIFLRFQGVSKVQAYKGTLDTSKIVVVYIPESNGYTIEGNMRGYKFSLLTKRHEPKIFRHLDTVADLLRELNVAEFSVKP